MSSKTERHVFPLFFPSSDEGSHLQGHTFVPLLPPSHCWGSSKSPFSPHPFVPGEATAALFWEQVGGGKALFIFFLLPSPFILLQALIIEGLNLSCSRLLPSFSDSVSNKGLWFGFGFGFFFFFFFSPPEI